MAMKKIINNINGWLIKLLARIAYVIGVPFIISFMLIVGIFEPFVYIITGISLIDKTCAIPVIYDMWFNKKFGIKTLNS